MDYLCVFVFYALRRNIRNQPACKGAENRTPSQRSPFILVEEYGYSFYIPLEKEGINKMIKLESISLKNGKKLITTSEYPQLSTWGIYNKTILEAPLYIGKSQIEAEKIGAFTFINLRSVHHETTNCSIECQSIGRFCMFAHSINIGFAGHPTDFISNHLIFRYDNKTEYAHDFMNISHSYTEEAMRNKYIEQSRKPLPIIGNDVWIGYGVTILNGVEIGDGAIIGAGSTVVKDVEPYSIIAGNPARTIRKRLPERDIETLLKISWWDYGPDILQGIDLSNTEKGIRILEERVMSRKYDRFIPPEVIIDNSTNEIMIKEYTE